MMVRIPQELVINTPEQFRKDYWLKYHECWHRIITSEHAKNSFMSSVHKLRRKPDGR